MDQKEHFHAVSPLNAPTICWHHLLGQSAGKVARHPTYRAESTPLRCGVHRNHF